MRVRLKDIAKALNISISTVNAALQNRPDISPKTRELVRQKVLELNYRPNRVARSLVTQKTNVIGVVVPDLSRSFFTEVTKGIDSVVARAGYHLLLCNTAEDPEREREEIETLISNQVDGLILASAHPPGTVGIVKSLSQWGVPYVLVDRFFGGAHFVGGNDDKIGFLATEHLIKEGYQSIAHIRGPNISTAIGRLRGYTAAMHRHGRTVRRSYVVEAQYHEESGGFKAMEQLLSTKVPPDAIFAASDPIAIGALQAIKKHGLRIPEDVGLIGVGNARYGEYLSVPLSTVDQNRGQIGREAGSLLLHVIEHGHAKPRKILLEPKLVIRESSMRNAYVAAVPRSHYSSLSHPAGRAPRC